MSGKEQAALSFSKCRPKSLCISHRGLFEKGQCLGPSPRGSDSAVMGCGPGLYVISSPDTPQAHLGLRTCPRVRGMEKLGHRIYMDFVCWVLLLGRPVLRQLCVGTWFLTSGLT